MPRKKKDFGAASPQALVKESALDRMLALRQQGHTYREIPLILNEGLAPGAKRWTQRVVHKMITDHLNKVAATNRDAAAHLIDLQHERLESMFRALDRRISTGDARAIEVGIRLLERQAKLHGLDAPVKQEVRVSHDDLTDAEVVGMLETLKAEVLAYAQPPVSGLLPGETSLPDHLSPPSASTPPPNGPSEAACPHDPIDVEYEPTHADNVPEDERA